jgi:acyl-CoA synthetase (AMP-forming)/AMP-acid ligase II
LIASLSASLISLLISSLISLLIASLSASLIAFASLSASLIAFASQSASLSASDCMHAGAFSICWWLGIPMVLARKFSASTFWKDVATNECTVVQYVGELCRYL